RLRIVRARSMNCCRCSLAGDSLAQRAQKNRSRAEIAEIAEVSRVSDDRFAAALCAAGKREIHRYKQRAIRSCLYLWISRSPAWPAARPAPATPFVLLPSPADPGARR